MSKLALISSIAMLVVFLMVWACAEPASATPDDPAQGVRIDTIGDDPQAAYVLTGGKWAHTAITYQCGYQALAQAVQDWAAVSGLVDGGCTNSNPDIKMQILDPWPFNDGTAGYASWQGSNGTITSCTVTEPTRYAEHRGILLHEVGHCLGLGHSADSNAAMYPYCCAPLGADDIAAIQALYGPGEAVPPTPTPGGCASSIWRDASGAVHGPFVSCGPYRLFAPQIARD